MAKRTVDSVNQAMALLLLHLAAANPFGAAAQLAEVPVGFAGPLPADHTAGKVKYWLVVGNSNICGRLYHDTNQPAEDYTHGPTIMAYGPWVATTTGDGWGWRAYAPTRDKGTGLCFNDRSAIGTLGPHDIFAREVARRDPDHYHAFLSFCSSGSSFEAWTMRTNDPDLSKTDPRANNFWRLFVRGSAWIGVPPMEKCGTDERWCRATEQMERFGDWAGLVVLADGDQVPEGRQLVSDLIAGYRATLDRPDLPAVLTEVAPWKQASNEVRQALLQVSEYVPNARCIRTGDLAHSDGNHYDRASSGTMAARYAAAFDDIGSNPGHVRARLSPPPISALGRASRPRLVLVSGVGRDASLSSRKLIGLNGRLFSGINGTPRPCVGVLP